MEIFIILILILLNGIFSMSEMALVSSRKFKLESESKKGNSGAKTALELSENPTRFFSTVQIGITLVGIFLGVYSGENLTEDIATIINKVNVLQPYAFEIATTVIVVTITYFSIVLGELLPKKIGMTFPEKIISILAKPMRLLSKITAPFVWLLTKSNNLLTNILGIKGNNDGKISEEEIKAIIKESSEGGEIQEIEQNIVERVFELGDRRVNSLYTHRSDLIYFNINDSWSDVSKTINANKHSVYPIVTNNNLDKIEGIVLLKDLFDLENINSFSLSNYLKQPIYVTENTSAYKVLESFKLKKVHYAIVLDEYGITQGIVTMDDIMDALIGDATEEGQSEFTIVQRDERSWLIDGQYSLTEFLKEFNIDINPAILENYTTVAGLIIHKLQSVPEVGDKIKINQYIFEIIDKDGQKIDKILLQEVDD